MMYYNSETRIKAISRIEELKEKIWNVPGDVLPYNDVRAISAFLNILADEIMKEDKADGEKNK